MQKFSSKTRAARHLIMLAITAGFFAAFFALLWFVPHEKGIPEMSVFMVLSLLIASAAASIPAYWGSKKLLPILAPRLWRAFLEALFSLPILNWFVPKSIRKAENNGSFSMQIEQERMRSFRQLSSNHAPGVAAANMGLSTDGDFLLNLIIKPIVFVIYLAIFLLLHLSYLALAIGVWIMLRYAYQLFPILGIGIITTAGIGMIVVFILQPIMCFAGNRRHGS